MSSLDYRKDLVQDCFKAVNNFKRHRAMADSKPQERDYHELKMYKQIDQLELCLRGLNKDLRDEETG